MMRCSVEPRGRIFVKGYGFLSFAKNMRRNIGKNISKLLSGKWSPGMLAMRQKLLDYAKQLASIHDGGWTHDLNQKKRTRCL